jgi:hypothetical protein
MNENILLIGNFEQEYLIFLEKKYKNFNIHYWHFLEQNQQIQNIKYLKFNDFDDQTLQSCLKNIKANYKLILVSSLSYWDNIRIIRNIFNSLSSKGTLVIDNITHRDEFYMNEISIYGHNLLYDSIEFVQKSKLLFSDIFPFTDHVFSANDQNSLILLRKNNEYYNSHGR